MALGSSVAGRTRSRRVAFPTFSPSGAVEKKKRGSFPLEATSAKAAGPSARKKSRGNSENPLHVARSRRDDVDCEVIVLDESSRSESPISIRDSEDEGSDSSARSSSERRSDGSVRADSGREMLPKRVKGGGRGGVAASVISIGASSDEDGQGTNEADKEWVIDEDSRTEECEESEDEEFSSAESEEEEEEKEEEDEDEDEEEPLEISGGVAGRTRSKKGPRLNMKSAMAPPSLSSSEGDSRKKDDPPSRPPRKKARHEKKEEGNRKEQSGHNSRGCKKNGVESDSDMLSSSVGPIEKQKDTAGNISMSENLNLIGENLNSDNSNHGSNDMVAERRIDWRKRATRKSEFFEILADLIWAKDGGEIRDEVLDEQPQKVKEFVFPVKSAWSDEEEAVEKTEQEKMEDEMWRTFNLALNGMGDYSTRNEDEDSEFGVPQTLLCSRGKHVLRDCCPQFETSRMERHYRSSYQGHGGTTSLDGLHVDIENCSSSQCRDEELSGTVWDLIPGTKSQMFPHQQEGFEFMWMNLAGSTMLDELKDSAFQKQKEKEIGGCIISHAPGTGKTRLTLVFLQSYLELFPNSHPIIIAPSSLLLTWEGEFEKWKVQMPCYNLNTRLSGKEDAGAMRMLDSHRLSRNMDSIRMVKLYSWSKTKGILMLSYDLFVQLAGEGSSSSSSLATKGTEQMRRILLEKPGLVILDEGHIPRNRESQVWNLMLKVKTSKRVILSGTPFQNNFEELLNSLYVVRRASSVPPHLKRLCQRGPMNQIGHYLDEVIDQLKAIMSPFVHLHNGSILQKSLPGRRDCVVVLNPSELQLEVLRSFNGQENGSEPVKRKRMEKGTFDFEHKQALISVHPYLAEKERLKGHKLNPSKGTKTWFVMEFIQLCLRMGEKVLIFSQFLKPLKLITRQLCDSQLKWTKGRDILLMVGDLPMKQRQSMINQFNDPDSDAKVLLASTRACSEGINLVGASRVLLLDVVWNPAVESQAISRAFRLGQKRVVYTYNLIMKGTSEWEKYQKQAKKDRISKRVFSAKTSSDSDTREKRPSTLYEDKILEEMTSHPKLKELFDDIIYEPKKIDSEDNFS